MPRHAMRRGLGAAVAMLAVAGAFTQISATARQSPASAQASSASSQRALLDRYEALWRARIDRLDALLASASDEEPTEGG